MNNPPSVETAWQSIDAATVLDRLRTDSEQGLESGEAAERLRRHGPNRLPEARRRAWPLRLLAHFHNVLIYVLLAAAVVTAATAQWIDTGLILGVVVITALLGFIQEGRAEQAMAALRGLLTAEVTVLRDGRHVTVPAETLVPGDIVRIQSGDRVPADLRLLDSRNLQIDEAPLTGESVPVSKDSNTTPEDTPLADCTGMAWSGTLVTRGRADGVVVATGADSELGRISGMLSGVQRLSTPLLLQMQRFARRLTLAIAALAAFTMAFGMIVHAAPAGEMFLAAVGIAVAAIPEGLPAILTIALALGVRRMATRNAIVRRLPAVEVLSAVNVICSDKTGTLTRNEMSVATLWSATQRYRVSGSGYERAGEIEADGHTVEVASDGTDALALLLRAGLLCNDATASHEGEEAEVSGDPTEIALVVAAARAGWEPQDVRRTWPRGDTIPFESEHRFMATLHHDGQGQGYVFVKGAPERILEMCNREQADGDHAALDTSAWQQRAEAIAGDGQRVLALACLPVAADTQSLDFDALEGELVMLGLTGMIDPPREEAIAAVAQCRSAGIGVKMITGDHPVTARRIGAELGIGDGEHALTGKDLDAMDDEQLREVLVHTDVFARVSPEHKLRLVSILQEAGGVIAVTGDGVNDAPALKRANIGLAMGKKGTEAAREAAEIVLADDNFATIAHAVEEGRTVYDNIRKSITFILPTNGGQAMMIVVAILLGTALPITPVQILWVNMVTAVTLALALAFEPPEPDTMQRPPRAADESILSGLVVWRTTLVSLLIVAGAFGLFAWFRQAGASLEEARTIAINAVVLFEIFYLLNSRFMVRSSLTTDLFTANPWVPLSIAGVLGLQLMLTYAPFMHLLLGTAPLDAGQWLLLVAITMPVFFVVELEKAVLRRFPAGKH